MEFGALKPLLTSLAMPPLAPLLLALLGLLLALKRRRSGLLMAALALALLWLLSCHGMAVWLARHALPQFAPLPVAELASRRVQAIVVLGGGLLPQAPEYTTPEYTAPQHTAPATRSGNAGNTTAQPHPATAARLRYGVWLARQSGLPLAFTGGAGWAAPSDQQSTEADMASRILREDHGLALRWSEAASRDTSGNARLLARLLQRDGVQRVALVTHAWHMPRASAAFEHAGLLVTPAPMGYVLPQQRAVLEWLPSAHGLLASQQVLREVLARAVAQVVAI